MRRTPRLGTGTAPAGTLGARRKPHVRGFSIEGVGHGFGSSGEKACERSPKSGACDKWGSLRICYAQLLEAPSIAASDQLSG